MTLFYERTMEDEALGPFFINELGEDITGEEWVEHIDLLVEFWMAKLLNHETYKGNLFGAHTRVPNIKRESFIIWQELFAIAADEIYVSEISELFKEKGRVFSEQFISFLKI